MKQLRHLTLIVAAFAVVVILTGCGHNAIQYGDGVGFDVGINPENCMLSMNLRYGKILSAVTRDNVELELTGQAAADGTAGTEKQTGVNTDGTLKVKIGRQINGAAVDLGYEVSFMTVKRIMNKYGYFPPTDGRTNSDWEMFFNAHQNVITACDFATYELVTPHGLQREHILFFENVFTREVWLGGIVHDPNGNWMAQIARNQCDMWDGKLLGQKYLIHDRDPLFCSRFKNIVHSIGCKTKAIPPRSPECNGYMESFIKTFKKECLNHFVLTLEAQLRYVVKEFLEYYNHERPHSALDGRMIKPWPQDADGEIVEFSRLGGLLKSYRRVKMAA